MCSQARYYLLNTLEYMSRMDREREKELDEALARMRAAFAEVRLTNRSSEKPRRTTPSV